MLSEQALQRAKKGATAKLLPLLRPLAAAGIKPSYLTAISGALAVLAILALIKGQFALAGLLIAAEMALDLLDGALARHLGRVTQMGALFDFAKDTALRNCYFLAVVAGGFIALWMAMLAVATTFLALGVATAANLNKLQAPAAPFLAYVLLLGYGSGEIWTVTAVIIAYNILSIAVTGCSWLVYRLKH
jgi:phosphatidylglycerophosphate synthase